MTHWRRKREERQGEDGMGTLFELKLFKKSPSNLMSKEKSVVQ